MRTPAASGLRQDAREVMESARLLHHREEGSGFHERSGVAERGVLHDAAAEDDPAHRVGPEVERDAFEEAMQRLFGPWRNTDRG